MDFNLVWIFQNSVLYIHLEVSYMVYILNIFTYMT